MGASPTRERRVYAYVPTDQVASVRRLGYLSARAQVDGLGGANERELVVKYAHQLAAARRDQQFREWRVLQERRGQRELDWTLDYLDWRDETTERGSLAVYFLFAPVPPEVTPLVLADPARRGLLLGRTLVSWKLPPRARVALVAARGHAGSPDAFFGRPPAYWAQKWRGSLATGSDESLWLEGIPHGYYIPEGGRVPPEAIAVAPGP
jgi:hypothetical protein